MKELQAKLSLHLMDKQYYQALDFKKFQQYDLRVNSSARRSVQKIWHPMFHAFKYENEILLEKYLKSEIIWINNLIERNLHFKF